MLVVENLLEELELSRIRILRVFNKADLVSREYAQIQSSRYQAVLVSALRERTFGGLMERIEAIIL